MRCAGPRDRVERVPRFGLGRDREENADALCIRRQTCAGPREAFPGGYSLHDLTLGLAIRGFSPLHIAKDERPALAGPPGRRKKARLDIMSGRAFLLFNRATSYSPTHLRVQYHRG